MKIKKLSLIGIFPDFTVTVLLLYLVDLRPVGRIMTRIFWKLLWFKPWGQILVVTHRLELLPFE